MAYLILLEEVEQNARAEMVAAATLAAAGQKVDIPDPVARKAEFKESLEAEPREAKFAPEKRDLMKALGVWHGYSG